MDSESSVLPVAPSANRKGRNHGRYPTPSDLSPPCASHSFPIEIILAEFVNWQRVIELNDYPFEIV